MDSDIIKKIYDRIESYSDSMVEFQTKMTAIPALGPDNDGEGESKKAAFIEEWLSSEIGFDEVHHFDAPDKRVPSGVRPNIAAVMKGASTARRIWVMAHMDIVPPGDLKKWDTDPYKVVLKDGNIYGRGTEDNQHGIVTPLFALKAIKELGAKLPYDVCIALVSDEETGSEYGIGYMLDKCDMFGKNDYIIVPDAGEPDGAMIEVAEKSIYWLKVETKGKQCHASTPAAGVNAHYAGAHLITRLHSLYEIFDRKDEVFDPPTSTFEATKKDANVPNINTIPGDDVFYLDMRVLPGIDLAEVDREIRSIADGVEKEFNVKITTSSVQKEEAAPATPVDAPVVRALARAIGDVYQIEAKPMGIGGGTVAAVFRRNGFNAVVWSKIEDTCHQPNEYTTLAGMKGDAKIFANLFLQE
ncbi:MAG: M20 family metallo-hydrolase [Candidatus Krumholzibacteriota bacterium]|nr:M20 family metallo-hydrolase [Candidatus Krumholzibacteriota bacterium]